ncbi:MAG: UDP-N-acetylmuramate dehydrogenase [Parcubacteria group bacterium]|nr:UDP-N-acetylmuramate dehydrogenase [Parcubacteria group bacterium]
MTSDKIYEKLQMELDNKVRRNEPLTEHTTFKIGGPAEFYYEAENTDNIVKAVKLAYKLKIDIFMLGGGSNILVSDEGLRGLVIKTKSSHLEIKGSLVTVDAGMWLNMLVIETLKKGLSGLEPLSGIPGTVGGAIFGNAGAWGKAIGEVVKQVEVLVITNKLVRKKTLNQAELGFSYRDSALKHGDYIVLRVQLKLKKLKAGNLLSRFGKVVKQRSGKHPLGYPNAGSIYKNIRYSEELKHLKKFEKYGKVSMGKIIDSLGFKGKKVGGAQVSSQHANFIVSTGEARAADVLELMHEVEREVENEYGVKLEREIRLVGF